MLDKTERKIKRLIRRAMSRIARDTRYQVPFDWLERRAERAERMRALSEGGDVAIVHGSRDCDGVRVDGCVTIIRAHPLALEKWEALQDKWADGPWWASLARPSDVATLRPTSRDLTLEAFENGHPHVIYD